MRNPDFCWGPCLFCHVLTSRCISQYKKQHMPRYWQQTSLVNLNMTRVCQLWKKYNTFDFKAISSDCLKEKYNISYLLIFFPQFVTPIFNPWCQLLYTWSQVLCRRYTHSANLRRGWDGIRFMLCSSDFLWYISNLQPISWHLRVEL